jgi:hypothetical protein
MVLNKYAKRLLREVLQEFDYSPASYAKKTQFERRSNDVPYGIKGNIGTMVVLLGVADGDDFIKSLSAKDRPHTIKHIAGHLLFGGQGDLSAMSKRLFTENEWPIGVDRDPVKRIKLFLKTDGKE